MSASTIVTGVPTTAIVGTGDITFGATPRHASAIAHPTMGMVSAVRAPADVGMSTIVGVKQPYQRYNGNKANYQPRICVHLKVTSKNFFSFFVYHFSLQVFFKTNFFLSIKWSYNQKNGSDKEAKF